MMCDFGCMLEIYETMVARRKYNRERVLATGWLFGGIERREGGEFRYFVRLAYDRGAMHLAHLIRQHVAIGTHIMPDGWGAYYGLLRLSHTCRVVIHDDNFD